MVPNFISAVARALLAGEPETEPARERLAQALGHPWRWLRPLARRYAALFSGHTRPTYKAVVKFLDEDEEFQRALHRHRKRLRIARWPQETPLMWPAPAACWGVPSLESAGALAEWLSLTVLELAWLADLATLNAQSPSQKLCHYRYRVVGKSGGSCRLIEAPKSRLKAAQVQILEEILEKIPVHPAAHGFAKGRSIKTFSAPHAAQQVVLRLDLRDFFPSFTAARIRGLFRTLGYPESPANLLTGLCTTTASREISKHAGESAYLYSQPHLPQGAPTSPALANLGAYRLDCRLNGLAEAAGARYTRYADDLAFSGGANFARCVERFSLHVAALAMEEGFRVHHRKTRVMRQGVRQHLTGLTVNHHPNVMRTDFDRLKATLTNCLRHGPASQNRTNHPAFRAHVEGKIAFVESINTQRGRKLRALFDKIAW